MDASGTDASGNPYYQFDLSGDVTSLPTLIATFPNARFRDGPLIILASGYWDQTGPIWDDNTFQLQLSDDVNNPIFSYPNLTIKYKSDWELLSEFNSTTNESVIKLNIVEGWSTMYNGTNILIKFDKNNDFKGAIGNAPWSMDASGTDASGNPYYQFDLSGDVTSLPTLIATFPNARFRDGPLIILASGYWDQTGPIWDDNTFQLQLSDDVNNPIFSYPNLRINWLD